jgi:hypothetical protein
LFGIYYAPHSLDNCEPDLSGFDLTKTILKSDAVRKPRESCELAESSESAASHGYEWKAKKALPVLPQEGPFQLFQFVSVYLLLNFSVKIAR